MSAEEARRRIASPPGANPIVPVPMQIVRRVYELSSVDGAPATLVDVVVGNWELF